MTMYIQVTFQDFCDAFRDMDRDDKFSYEGQRALFEYLEDEDIELDIIALCCEYQEGTYAEIMDAYSIQVHDTELGADVECAVRDYLEQHTSVVGEVTGGFVYADF
jgi:hypothetical protein